MSRESRKKLLVSTKYGYVIALLENIRDGYGPYADQLPRTEVVRALKVLLDSRKEAVARADATCPCSGTPGER